MLSVEQAGALLGVPQTTIREWIRCGLLLAVHKASAPDDYFIQAGELDHLRDVTRIDHSHLVTIERADFHSALRVAEEVEVTRTAQSDTLRAEIAAMVADVRQAGQK